MPLLSGKIGKSFSRGLPLSMYAPRGRGFKSPIHFYCVLHAKGGEGVKIAWKFAYVLNGSPLHLFRLPLGYNYPSQIEP